MLFDSVVAETEETLPEVESVLYEDEIGLVGWIKSERILVGSRTLMEKYSVEVPNMEYERNILLRADRSHICQEQADLLQCLLQDTLPTLSSRLKCREPKPTA